MVFRSSTTALLLCGLVSCKPAAAPSAADAGATASTPVATPTPKAPELPDCERHAAVFAAAVSQKGDATKPLDLVLRGAFNHYQDAYRAPCKPEVEWQAAAHAIALLDDARMLYDHTASEMRKVLVQDAAVLVLERVSGTTQGKYDPPKIDAKPDEAQKLGKANAEVREKWKKWWTTAKDERDKWLEQAKKRVTEDQALLEQQNLAKLMVSTLSVLHSWELIPWTTDALTPNDVVKKPGFVPEMLQPPVHPSLIEDVKWGWYLKKDGAIYRVLRREEENGKEWRLDAYKQETSKVPGDAKKIIEWTLADKIPLASIKPGQQVGIPPAFVEWLRQQPGAYYAVLASGTFGATVLDGNRVYLIALRGGEIPM